MHINPLLLPVLQKIKFVDRYKSISLKYQFFDERFASFEIDRATRIIEAFGYAVKYNKSEKFFKIIESVADFKIQFNISLNGGIVEFMYGITKNGERLKIGGSVNTTIEIITESDFTVKPCFRNYDDLKEILNEAFDIYEDFKKVLLTVGQS